MTAGLRPTSPLVGDHSTLADAFEAAAEQHGDRLASVSGASRLSFADWYRRADVLARGLVEFGVRPGDVVVMMLPSTSDYAVAYGAIALAGAVATGITPRLGRREIDAVLGVAAPRLVIHDPVTFAHGAFDAVCDGVPVVELDEVVAA